MLKLQRENSILSKAQSPSSLRSKTLSEDAFSKHSHITSSPQPSPPGSRPNRSGSVSLQSVSDQSESNLSISQNELKASPKPSYLHPKEQKPLPIDNCDIVPDFTVQGPSNRRSKGAGHLKGSRRRVVPAKKWFYSCTDICWPSLQCGKCFQILCCFIFISLVALINWHWNFMIALEEISPYISPILGSSQNCNVNAGMKAW